MTCEICRRLRDQARRIEEEAAYPGADPDLLRAAAKEIDRWKSNHSDVVETKRGTDARLKSALAGLQQIYTVCSDNAASSSDHKMALDFVRQVAGDVFETATKNLPRAVWQSPQGSTDAS